jgi:hypothetical protein
MARPGNQIAGREHVDATPILIGMRPSTNGMTDRHLHFAAGCIEVISFTPTRAAAYFQALAAQKSRLLHTATRAKFAPHCHRAAAGRALRRR